MITKRRLGEFRKKSPVLQRLVPVVLVGATAITLVLSPLTRKPVTAQDTAALTATQMTVATSLENAFMRIAETVGPATVSIEAVEPTLPLRSPSSPKTPRDSERSESSESDSEGSNGSDPFDELFGPNRNPFRRLPRSVTATGSGVIVRPDGYILTNDHIVEAARSREVSVTLADGTLYKGKVLRDFSSDLALVKITPEKPLPYVKLADSSKVRVGQWAVAIGSPFGQQNTVTTGIVSALHRKREIADGSEARLYPNLIQTDASINPGNSGGPLLNIQGEMIGINVAIYSPTGTSLGIGYAIPSNTVKTVMEQLITKGKVVRGSLGIIPEDVPPGLRRRLATTKGAYVREIVADTAADKAGIQVEDVITRFHGQDINDEGDLREVIAQTPPDTRVTVVLLREGKPVTLNVTLDARPELTPTLEENHSPVALRSSAELGFEVAALGTETSVERNLPQGLRGLRVRTVSPGSPAMQARLTPGHIVLSVNGKPVTTPDALNFTITQAKPGDTVTLLVYRPGDRTGEKSSRVAVNIVVP